jgi:asparaginyl-tRNA synthetase
MSKVRMLDFRETYEWSSLVLSHLRQSIEALGFREVVPALCAERSEPGARHSVAVLGDRAVPIVEQANGGVNVSGWKSYFLPVSFVVEKQMSLEFMERVYCLAPCLRLLMEGEAQSTKHLYNFFQFEIEWRTESMEAVFQTGEQLLCAVAECTLRDLEARGLSTDETVLRNITALAKADYPRIRFVEALEMLGKDTRKPVDLNPDDDARLTLMFDKPFWIYDYPEGVRDSIYHRNDRGFYDTYDLMLPFGYGELTTGGVRCKTGAEIVRQSQVLGKAYSAQYAAWKDRAGIQTAGFGIGLERLLRYMSGAETILEFVQYHDDGPNNVVDPEFISRKRSATAQGRV